MPTTPELDLPYPAAGSPDNVPYDMQLLAEAVETQLLGVVSDSFFTPESGITVDLMRAARIGPLAVIQIELSGVTYSSGEQSTNLGTLDLEWWPIQNCAALLGRGGSGAQIAGTVREDTGLLYIRNSTEAASSTTVVCSATYILASAV